MSSSTINNSETDKFSKLANEWWDLNGPLKTLHDVNGPRLSFIQENTLLTNKKVLDVGCGGGILSERLAENCSSVVAIDAAAEVIEVARVHASHIDNLQYLCTPIESLDAHSFDVITCMEMLEHIDNPGEVIRHCYEKLAPGGYLFLSTINRNAYAYATAILAAEYLLKILPKQTHEYKKFIKPSELSATLRDAGFKVMTIKGLAYNPLTRHAALSDKVHVNYLLAAQK